MTSRWGHSLRHNFLVFIQVVMHALVNCQHGLSKLDRPRLSDVVRWVFDGRAICQEQAESFR